MSLAFVFPGQGSQFVGMMKDFYETKSEIKPLYDTASDILGYDLYDLCVNGPEQRLGLTEVTQPAVLVAGYAIWQLVRDKIDTSGLVLAGHSLGEYTALVCAGSIAFEDAVALVRYRGQLMQNAVPEGVGAMAAVLGLDDATIEKHCGDIVAATGGIVEPVNYNAPGQVVIAGQKESVAQAIRCLKEAGARRALFLPVSVPAHSSLMKTAAEKLSQRLQKLTINVPAFPVIHNVDAQTATNVESIRDKLALQVHSPVLWKQTVQRIAEGPTKKMLECGPGKVLTGLNKRISKKMQCLALNDIENLEMI
ncbi:MAG: [acyl-carrier-protein] S-malonyltransferase [Gammaproteobacteria bacterium]|nr:MAG: [acyl-carrier-protein] S-malonyltransferase [Gammaproteobacteria bacterium]